MSIAVRCQCGQGFSAKDELAGKRVKCPKCGTTFVVPAASTSPPAAKSPPKPPSPQVPPPAAPPAPSVSATQPSDLGSLFDEEEIGLAGPAIPAGQGKPCPGCRKLVPLQAVVCVECGWSFEEGKKLETQRGPAKRKRPEIGPDTYFDDYEEEQMYSGGRKRRGTQREEGRTGPAWEGGAELGSYFQTLIDILISPAATFSKMDTQCGLGGPITFVLAGTAIAYVISVVISLGFTFITGKTPQGQEVPAELFGAYSFFAVASICCGIVCTVIVAGIFMPAWMFLSASIHHLGLLMLGGAKRPFQATFRAVGYVAGGWVIPYTVLSLLPVVGFVLSSLLQSGYTVIALKHTHENQWWQSLLAVLLWLGFLAGLVAFIVLAVIMPLWSDPEFQRGFQEALRQRGQRP